LRIINKKRKMKNNKKKRNLRNILFTIIIAFAIVSFWRGIWGLMDLYLFPENQVVSLLVSVLLGIIILYFTKHLLTNLA